MAERQQEGMEAFVDRRVRLALGQRLVDDRTGRRQAGQFAGAVHRLGGVRLAQFAGVVAELLGEPRPPGDLHHIAGLPDRPPPPRHAAMHEARVPAMRLRQQVDHQRVLAVRPAGQHDALIGPVHDARIPPACRGRVR
jgi:hypothetical protein